MIKLNMRSSADNIESQEVGSCYDEQVTLVKTGLAPDLEVTINEKGRFDLVHYHTVDFWYYIKKFTA